MNHISIALQISCKRPSQHLKLVTCISYMVFVQSTLINITNVLCLVNNFGFIYKLFFRARGRKRGLGAVCLQFVPINLFKFLLELPLLNLGMKILLVD